MLKIPAGGEVVRGGQTDCGVTARRACRGSFLAAAMFCGACAHAPLAPAHDEIVQRGVLIARGWSVAELTKGPALVHVYSQSIGGTVYITATAPGGTGECTVQAPATALAEASL